MNRSGGTQAWVVRAGWVGLLGAMTLGGGAALGQMDQTSPEAPLGGPAVKDREVPGVAQTFGDAADGKNRRAVERIPARVLRQAMMEALGERAPEHLRLSDEQRRAVQSHFRDHETQMRDYLESHRAELNELRRKLPPEAMKGPAGEMFRRLEGGPREPGVREPRGEGRGRGEPREHARGEGRGRKSAAEIPVEVRERLRELVAAAPSVEALQTRIWAELRPEQQKAVNERLARFRERMAEHREEMYVKQRVGKGKAGPDGDRKPPKGRGPEGGGPRGPRDDAGPRAPDRRERLMRAFERMTPERQEQLLRRIEARRDEGGPRRGGGERGRGRGEDRPMPKEPPVPPPGREMGDPD